MKWSRPVSLVPSLVPALVTVVVSALGLLLAVQCSSVPPQDTATGKGITPGGPGVKTGACTAEGQSQACHAVTAQHNGYVDCFNGQQSCVNGAWGPCDGSGGAGGGTVSMHALPLNTGGAIGGLQLNSLSDASDTTPPCSTDFCNPYCWGYTETPPTPIGPPPGCVITSGGAGTCQVGTGGYSVYLLAGDQVNVASCTPTSSITTALCPTIKNSIAGVNLYDTSVTCDDCNFDTECVGTTCTQWAVGGSHAACSGCTQGDLTLGYPCLGTVGNGATYHFPVCNRGSGTLSGTGPAGAGPAIRIGLYKSATVTSANHSQ